MTQRIAECAQTAVFNLLRTGCLALVALVLFSWMFSIESDDGVGSRRSSGSSYARPGMEATRVRMAVSAGRPCSACSLEDESGEEILRVTYLSSGFVVVNLGEMFPIRPGFSAGVDGNYDFALAHEGVNHRLKVRPDGASGFTIASQSRRMIDESDPAASEIDDRVSSMIRP